MITKFSIGNLDIEVEVNHDRYVDLRTLVIRRENGFEVKYTDDSTLNHMREMVNVDFIEAFAQTHEERLALGPDFIHFDFLIYILSNRFPSIKHYAVIKYAQSLSSKL